MFPQILKHIFGQRVNVCASHSLIFLAFALLAVVTECFTDPLSHSCCLMMFKFLCGGKKFLCFLFLPSESDLHSEAHEDRLTDCNGEFILEGTRALYVLNMHAYKFYIHMYIVKNILYMYLYKDLSVTRRTDHLHLEKRQNVDHIICIHLHDMNMFPILAPVFCTSGHLNTF